MTYTDATITAIAHDAEQTATDTAARGCRRPFFGEDEAAQRRMKGL